MRFTAWLKRIRIAPNESDAKRRRRRAAATVGGASLIVWMGAMMLWNDYAVTRPNISDPGSGRVYALNTHGRRVFLTLSEWSRLLGAQAAAAILFITAARLAKARRANQSCDSGEPPARSDQR